MLLLTLWTSEWVLKHVWGSLSCCCSLFKPQKRCRRRWMNKVSARFWAWYTVDVWLLSSGTGCCPGNNDPVSYFPFVIPFDCLRSVPARPPQLVSTRLCSAQCSCCVSWPVLWSATSWTGEWRSVKRRMQTHKQRRGMKGVKQLLFRRMQCCRADRHLDIFLFKDKFKVFRFILQHCKRWSHFNNSSVILLILDTSSIALCFFNIWPLSLSANQIPQRDTARSRNWPMPRELSSSPTSCWSPLEPFPWLTTCPYRFENTVWLRAWIK